MTEIWKDIIGYEGMYQVSSLGRVKNWRTGRILKASPRNGYMRLPLRKDGKDRTYSVHRLVAEAFVPNPNHLSEVNHKNKIKNDNQNLNLEWVSGKQNTRHAFKDGNSKIKLTFADAQQVRSLYSSRRFTCKILAHAFGVCRQMIGLIINNKRWIKESYV